MATLNEQIIDAKTARHDADGHKNSFKRLDQTARAIGRLGDELVSHRDQQRVSRQTQKLRQGFQALSDKIDMKVKELMEMGNEFDGNYVNEKNRDFRQRFCDQTTSGGGWTVPNKTILVFVIVLACQLCCINDI